MSDFVDPASVQCPSCNTANPKEIVYGLPSDEMASAAHLGFIELGGCIVDDDSPAYRCRECGEEFGSLAS